MTTLLDRRQVVARLMRDRGDTLAVSGLGSATYDLAAAGDDPCNFYLWGAMGGAAVMGLGLALAQPTRPVVVLTGDGEALMGLGGFATIALQKPKNLSVVILDNGLYGETGAQATHTAGGADIAKIAAACGISETRTVTKMDEVDLTCRPHHADRRGASGCGGQDRHGLAAARVAVARRGLAQGTLPAKLSD